MWFSSVEGCNDIKCEHDAEMLQQRLSPPAIFDSSVNLKFSEAGQADSVTRRRPDGHSS